MKGLCRAAVGCTYTQKQKENFSYEHQEGGRAGKKKGGKKKWGGKKGLMGPKMVFAPC